MEAKGSKNSLLSPPPHVYSAQNFFLAINSFAAAVHVESARQTDYVANDLERAKCFIAADNRDSFVFSTGRKPGQDFLRPIKLRKLEENLRNLKSLFENHRRLILGGTRSSLANRQRTVSQNPMLLT